MLHLANFACGGVASGPGHTTSLCTIFKPLASFRNGGGCQYRFLGRGLSGGGKASAGVRENE